MNIFENFTHDAEKRFIKLNLYELTEQYQTLLEMAMSGDESHDYESFLTGMEGAINDKLDAYCKVIKTLEANEETIAKEMSRLSIRKQSIANEIKRMKESMKVVMIQLNMKKHKSPLFTVSVSKGREKVEIFDVAKIPDEYKKIQDPIADKKSIMEAIKAGQEIQGAKIVVGEAGLMIR